MEYPRKVMRSTELQSEMGFSRRYMDRAIRTPGQKFAFKQNPFKKNSPVMIDTEEFEKWRQKEAALFNRELKRGLVI